MMMMMNCFRGMVNRRKAFSLISSLDHCQRSSPLSASYTPRTAFEPTRNLSSGLVEWNCAVVITTTPLLHGAMCSCSFLVLFQDRYMLPVKYPIWNLSALHLRGVWSLFTKLKIWPLIFKRYCKKRVTGKFRN